MLTRTQFIQRMSITVSQPDLLALSRLNLFFNDFPVKN
jgi:hypothetical protein